jgi:hypothetical protein
VIDTRKGPGDDSRAPLTMVSQTDPSVPRGSVILLAQRDCPLVRAVLRLGDPELLLILARVHPPRSCPAARRTRRKATARG